MSTETVADFVRRLETRGFALILRNNRLWFLPEKGWQMLTDEERTFIRQHRIELKEIARTPDHILTLGRSPTGQTPGKGNDLSINSLQEPAPEQAQAQAALRHGLGWDFNTVKEAITPGRSGDPDDPTKVMLKQIGKPLPDWYWE